MMYSPAVVTIADGVGLSGRSLRSVGVNDEDGNFLTGSNVDSPCDSAAAGLGKVLNNA